MDQKTLARLEEFENSKQYYDALQFYRTKVTRSFRLNNSIESSSPLVQHAIDFFLREKQYQCAIDIITLYAETLSKNSAELNDVSFSLIAETSAKLAEIIEENQFSEQDENLLVSSRRKFVEIAVDWSKSKSSSEPEHKFGSHRLHFLFAKQYLKSNFIDLARNHFLLSDQAEDFANFLYLLWQNHSAESEFDLIIAQVVLQLLCIDRFPYARQLFTAYTSKSDKKSGATFTLPLLNFINILFEVIAKVDVTQYSVIVETYMSEIVRDESFKGYLSKIGKMYFGIRDNQNMGGGLAGMLSGLMGGGEKDEVAKSHLSASPPAKMARFSVPASVLQARGASAASSLSSQQKKPSSSEAAMETDDLD